MDLTSPSADWMSHLDAEDDYGHGWTQLEMAPFHSGFQPSQSDCSQRAAKQLKRSSDLHQFSGSTVISFGGSSSAFLHSEQIPLHCDTKPKLEAPEIDPVGSIIGGSSGGGPRSAPAAASGAREHVIAERKRREKLTQRFITLSALLPGLKKLDKASVLGEAARYVKQLEEQVKTLEEQSSQSGGESVVINPRKTRISSTEQEPKPSSSSSSNDNFDSPSSGDPVPEIEARFSGKDVLISLHCQMKQQGIVPKVLSEIQKLNLSIVNCNAMPFGEYNQLVTVVAKMNDEFSATRVELVNMIRQNL